MSIFNFSFLNSLIFLLPSLSIQPIRSILFRMFILFILFPMFTMFTMFTMFAIVFVRGILQWRARRRSFRFRSLHSSDSYESYELFRHVTGVRNFVDLSWIFSPGLFVESLRRVSPSNLFVESLWQVSSSSLFTESLHRVSRLTIFTAKALSSPDAHTSPHFVLQMLLGTNAWYKLFLVQIAS